MDRPAGGSDDRRSARRRGLVADGRSLRVLIRTSSATPRGRGTGLRWWLRRGIESKVGRTSLTAATRSQIAKDGLLLRNRDVASIEWVFSRSGVTGKIGPTGPLAGALSEAGIPWRLAP